MKHQEWKLYKIGKHTTYCPHDRSKSLISVELNEIMKNKENLKQKNNEKETTANIVTEK